MLSTIVVTLCRVLRPSVRSKIAAHLCMLFVVCWIQPAHAQCIDNVEVARLLAGDGAADDLFGRAVAIAGDTLVVGALGDDIGGVTNRGSAYVFVRTGNSWVQQAKLTASDGGAVDDFGNSVAISGETIVVGAFLDDIQGRSDAGSVYVFTRTGTEWTQEAKLVASDGLAGDEFGFSVSIAGDTIVVGARYDDTPAGDFAGSAYIFVRDGSAWTQQAHVTAPDAGFLDQFGTSVSISADTILIGNFQQAEPGAAYVFVRSGTAWSHQATLLAPDGEVDDRFGSSVSLSVDTAIIGAYTDSYSGIDQTGSAYIFNRSGVAWTQPAKLTANDAADDDNFGISVAISGDTVIVGSRSHDVNFPNDGAAYVFKKTNGVWLQESRLTATDGAMFAYFGDAVALAGEDVVVGSLGNAANGHDAGAVYAYRVFPRLIPLEITSQPASVSICTRIGASFSVTAVGCPLAYQWQYAVGTASPASWADVQEGANADASGFLFTAAGSTSTSLAVNHGMTPWPSDEDSQLRFRCEVTNAAGTSATAAATLRICTADLFCDGTVNSGDFFGFLAAFFSGAPIADFDMSGQVTSVDFFDFLAAFFAGCG